MAGSFKSSRKQLIRQLRTDMTEVCKDHAERQLGRARANINDFAGEKGTALGAAENEQDLIASGYIAGAGKSGYDQARERASGGNDAKRGLWADEVHPVDPSSGVRFVIAFALARANLMHDGYSDPIKEKNMKGVPFLLDAFDQEAHVSFTHDAGLAVKRLEGVHLKTQEQRDAEKEERYRRAQNRKVQAETKANQKAMFSDFLAAHGDTVSEIRRNTGGEVKEMRIITRGPRKGQAVPIRRKMDKPEVQEQIEQLFNDWKSRRNDY